MKGTLSLWGLLEIAPTVLDNLNVPTGVDDTILKDHIILDAAELELLYPDPDFMATAISVWSLKELPVWNRVFAAEQLTYNPIENYDRNETWSDNRTTDRNASTTSSGTSNGENRGNSLNYGYGFNENSQVLQNSEQHEDYPSTTVNSSDTGTENVTDANAHTGRVHGNIGVKTTQSMLMEELDVAPKLNIYDYITKSFIRRFCLLIY